MAEDDSTSSFGLSAAVLTAIAFVCGGLPALLICGGIGASFGDIFLQFLGQ